MTISADTHIILDMHSPKKDATIGEGVPTVPDGSCAIWANAITDPELTTQTIASWWSLYNTMMDAAKKGSATALIVSMPIDASDVEVVFAAPGAGEIGFYMGVDIVAGAKTHFVKRTLIRLIERWLELAKTGSGATPA